MLLSERGIKQCQTDDDSKLYHFNIVRADLPEDVRYAQLAHAAGNSSTGSLPDGTYVVVLAARDESHLKELEAKLKDLGIPHRAIYEPDPPYHGEMMAIGIVPCERSVPKRVTSNLPLLKPNRSTSETAKHQEN